MEFIKIRDVKNPERDASENAGIDFYIPERHSFSDQDISEFGEGVEVRGNSIYIEPHCDVVIPAGIMSKFDNNIALIANNKSGIAIRKKLIFGASVIDASYQGEWHFHLINVSNKVQSIDFGQKIIQFVPHIISTDEVVIRDMSPTEFFTKTTKRKDGKFGSTGV